MAVLGERMVVLPGRGRRLRAAVFHVEQGRGGYRKATGGTASWHAVGATARYGDRVRLPNER